MTSPLKNNRFEDLIVWQKTMVLSKDIYRISSDGPLAKDWGLKDQVRRASVSILSNIAEGFGKYSNPEFRKYLAIANGSTFELRAQLHLARELGYIGELEAEMLIRDCSDVSKLIAALRVRMK
jgi:four helix bundle protein